MATTAPSTIGGRRLGANLTRPGRTEPAARSAAPAAITHAGRVARFVAGTLAVFTLALGVGLAFIALGPAVISGWDPVVITSGSMEPGIKPGDIVVAQPTDLQNVGVGSIVVFSDPQRGGLVTHRVASVNADGTLVTKGDANQTPDSQPVASTALVGAGRLVVPVIGRPIVWFRQGDWANILLLGGATLGCLYTSRFGLQTRFDPWAEL